MITISGVQYVDDGESRNYIVSGIPTGYLNYSLSIPDGWVVDTYGAISGTSQIISMTTGIGSGTLAFYYWMDSSIIVGTLDVYSGATRMGEEISRDGIFVPAVIPNIPSTFCDDNSDCFFSLPVFADPDNPTNKITNDKSDFLFYGSSVVQTLDIVIQRNGIDVATITDNTYGVFFSYGKANNFSGASYKDSFGKRYTGIFLDWLKVYNIFGAGNYRIKIVQTDIFSIAKIYYSKNYYCLQKYNCHIIDGTVRIETYTAGLRGTMDDASVQIDYQNGWHGMVRFRGMLTQQDPSYTKEYNQYGEGYNNLFLPIVDEQTPKFKLQIKSVPGYIDWFVSTNILQADKINITDYNSKNRNELIRLPLKDGNMKVINKQYTRPLAEIEIDFSYGQNNLRRRNSF